MHGFAWVGSRAHFLEPYNNPACNSTAYCSIPELEKHHLTYDCFTQCFAV